MRRRPSAVLASGFSVTSTASSQMNPAPNAGQYAMTPDRRPLLGPTPIDGLYVNTGYSGKGVMAGPAGSRHLVDVLTGKIRSEDNPYRLDRPFTDRPRLDPL